MTDLGATRASLWTGHHLRTTVGRASSALQLNDAIVQSLVLALGSVVFASFAGSAPATGAVILVMAGAVLGALSLLPAARLR